MWHIVIDQYNTSSKGHYYIREQSLQPPDPQYWEDFYSAEADPYAQTPSINATVVNVFFIPDEE